MRVAAALVLALLLLVPLAPPAGAAGSRVWSSASEISLVDADKVVETRRITYDGTYYSPTWKVSVPAGATFREARDATGALTATLSGDQVTVATRGSGVSSYSFTLTFDLRPRSEPPFLSFNATVPGDHDSPTSVTLTLPSGWTRAGWFGWSGSSPDASGVFRKTGGQVVEFLVLPPGAPDPGPDPRVEGHGILREASASLSATGGRLDVTTTYDTDVYGHSWQIPLPEGATLVDASSPWGPLPATVSDGMVTLQTPYKAGYHLGARPFRLELALPAPDPFGGPYRQANLSLAAAQGDDVRLQVALADGLTHVGDSVSGGVRAGPLRYEAGGPMRARVAFLPPAPAESVRFSAGAYVVQAPRELEAPARATALNASQLLPSALGFLGGADLTRPFFVAYTDANVFSWEEGFYTHGLDAISIRASELRERPEGRARLVPVGTLVHETAHGLLDRAFTDSPDDLSFLHEGVSRLAETHVERHFPDEVVTCTTQGPSTQCQRQSARPEPDRAQAFLRGGTFDATWGADAATSETRGFLYDWSGLVFHAYERAAGPEALAYALAELAEKDFADEPQADAETVVAALLAWAPGLSREQLLYPGRQVAQLDPAPFRACMGDLLPPPYPFEAQGSAPASGCGWPQVGTREPPPPTPTPPPPSPVVTSPPPRTTPAPSPVVASPPAEPTPTPTPEIPTEEEPVPVERAGVTPATTPSAGVPAPPLALLLGAAALAGLLLRRR